MTVATKLTGTSRTEPGAHAPAEGGLAMALTELLAEAIGGPVPLRLRAWDGSEAGAPGAPVVVLRSPDALRRLIWHPGELGVAQGYVTGDIDIEGDLTDAIRHVWAARSAGTIHAPRVRALAPVMPRALRLAGRSGVLGAPIGPPDSQARLRGRRHSRRRDRAAISHHYDLSNDFYALILDADLVYSCGYWTSDDPGYGIAEAQADKLDLVCRKLGLRPGLRLLDVGCGWGALAIHAARHFGVHSTGITLSTQQAEFAGRRVAALGLGDRVDIRLQDYRELRGAPFDAISSLEMGEHVGRANYPTYTAKLHGMVRPGGRVLIQQMSRGPVAPGGGAFIEAFIAPDMNMAPVGDTVNLIEGSGLEVRDVHALREHYARTLRAWHGTLEARWAEAVDLVGEEVARVWRLYLAGAALNFEVGGTGVDQILAVRPDAVGGASISGLPSVRST